MNVAQFMQYLMANNIGKILNSKTANIQKIESSVGRFEDAALLKFREVITGNLPAIYLVDIAFMVDTFINVFDPNNVNNSATYKQVLSSFTVNNNTYNIRDLYTETSLEDVENYDIAIHAIHSALWHNRDRLISSILTMISAKVSKRIVYGELAKQMDNALQSMDSSTNAIGILESMAGDIDVSTSKSVITQNLNRSIIQAGTKLQAYYAKNSPAQIQNPEQVIANFDRTKHLLLFGATFDELKNFVNKEINGNLEVLISKGIGGKSLFSKGTNISFAKYGYTEDYGFEGNRGNTKVFREQAQAERGQVIGVSIGNLVAAGHTAALTNNNGVTEVLAINTPLTIKTMTALNAEGHTKGYDVSSYVSSTPHLQHGLQFTKEAVGSTNILAKGLLQFVVGMETNFNSIHLGKIEKAEIDKQTLKLINKKTDEIQSSFIKTLLLPKTLNIIKGALRWSPTIEENIVNNIMNSIKPGSAPKGVPASASTRGDAKFLPLKAILGKSKSANTTGSTKSISLPKVVLKAPSPPKVRSKSGQFTSLISIQSLINQALSEKIKQNMGSPALNNRTGRFAESAKVTNMSQSRAGMITAFYQWMRYPYATFSEGGKQYTKAREPKTLISKSIREIASSVVGNRLRAVSL